MLTLRKKRLLFIIGVAAVSLSAPCIVPASSLGLVSGADEIPFFPLDVSPDSGYYAHEHANSGSLTFTFSNPNDFAAKITRVDLHGLICLDGDCEDRVANLALETGTTCGVGGFLQPNGKNPCTVEAGFDLLDDRRPDPDKDYGHWDFVTRVDAIKAGTKPGDPGYAEGAALVFGDVYVLDKGVTAPAPEPASLSLMLAGALIVLLSKAISVVRSSGEKSATKIAHSPV